MKKKGEKPEYDKLNIEEIERKIAEFRALSYQMQAKMYECLEYLRTTHRYMENPMYARSTFWEYLEDRWMMRKRAYYDHTRIFAKYPLYADKYGPGLVGRMDRECGPMRVEKVMAAIHQEESERKSPITRTQIGEIIEKYRKTDGDRVERVSTDWRAMYEHERIAHEETKDALRFIQKQLREANEQIAKLKAAVVTKKYERPRTTRPFETHENRVSDPRCVCETQ